MKNAKVKNSLPYMCLLMIVKNESHIILETLEMLKGIIDYWVICDTGSTDNTQELIKNFFSTEKIQGELHQHEWKNFGHNRTLAFQAAFNKSRYVFVFDADDKIHGNLAIPKNLNHDAVFLKFGEVITYVRMQIFKNSLKWEYRGVLHEFPNCVSKKSNQIKSLHLGGDYFIESRRLGSRNQDPHKYEKDAKLLLDAIENKIDPDLKPRYLFYLAQSYRDSNDFDNAIKYYTLRAQERGWNQEVYYSCWQVGRALESKHNLNKYFFESQAPFSVEINGPQGAAGPASVEKNIGLVMEITKWYLKAHEVLPERAESLASLGILMYKLGAYEKSFYYLNKVKNFQIPNEALFADESLYKFFCHYHLSFVTNKLANFELSSQFSTLFLSKYPEHPEDKLFFGDIRLLQRYNSQKKTIENNLSQFYESFLFFENKDVFGYDIHYAADKTIDEVHELTLGLKNANAFNTLGYIKNLPDEFYVLLTKTQSNNAPGHSQREEAVSRNSENVIDSMFDQIYFEKIINLKKDNHLTKPGIYIKKKPNDT